MATKEKHYLKQLAEKSRSKEITEAEDRLLDNFMRHEYDHAEWDTSQMGSKEKVASDIYSRIKRPSVNYYNYAAAAAIVILVGLGILFSANQHQVKELTVTTAATVDSLRLDDGTVVYLAANTSFKYPEHFTGQIRAVSLLKGNAFFKVAKDKAHPFIITSEEIKTKVLGTSFHISLEKGSTSVTVVTGHVCVYTNNQKTFLKPNENAIYANSKLEKHKLKDMALYGWYKQDVQLNDVSLEHVFTLLKFKYGVDFEPKDQQILATRMTLYMKDGLPLQKILDQINYITHLKFKRYGDQIIVSN
ncbi:FecR family protein [Pedobacter antarcticus]|uniref:FecR family protein n=1 Tax=Pedobacter antarcticus TaxID=34086 RepID=UPI001C572186|nr:FecR domain-containing protein [Pedobacter antarcticus]